MKIIRWLHLSDLHYTSGSGITNYNRETVLEALWTDLKTQIGKGLQPDFIFFTGDIAYRGQDQEYELAAKCFFDPLLEITGLSKDRLFIVPGNHDIDWDKIDIFHDGAMLQCLISRDNANSFLDPNRAREQYFQKFQAYSDFVNKYFDGALSFDPVKYFYTRRLELSGIKIGILGLNSVWMSACRKTDQDKALDQGNLLIGERQLKEALKENGDVDLRIALLHHPLEWLHETDRFEIEKRLNAKCDFILHGHWHVPQVRVQYSVAGQAVYIPAGAVYTSRNYPNGYNLAQVNLDTGKIQVHLRRYNNSGPEGPEWTADTMSTGEANAGSWEVDFSQKDLSIPPITGKKRILLVENDFSWEQIVKELLSPDFDIEVAQTYRQAREIIEHFSNSFDLVIINLCLGNKNNDLLGLKILEVLQTLSPHTPCVIFTGHSTSMKSMKHLFERFANLQDAFTKGEYFSEDKFIQTILLATSKDAMNSSSLIALSQTSSSLQ